MSERLKAFFAKGMGPVPQNFKVGDVVRLKSSDPKMTVRAVDTDADTGEITIFCDWFSGNTAQHENFPADALRDASNDMM